MKHPVTVPNMREFQKSVFSACACLLLATSFLNGESLPEPAAPPAVEAGEKAQGGTAPTAEPAKGAEAEPITEAAAEAAEEANDSANTEGLDEVRQVYGWKEWVRIGTKAEAMRAKLDSGARTSSLHAEGVEEFERDGRPWVRFTLTDANVKDFKEVLIKAPVQRVARVKNTDATIERRFVVELGFEIGGRQLREEFTLNDRTTMTCPVLIGRNALRHLGYLDCSRVDLADKKVMK